MSQDKPILLFGNGRFAELSAYVLTHDSPFSVAAFVVDRAYITKPETGGIPVIAFEDCSQTHPPDYYDMIVPLGYQGLNSLRMDKYRAAKAMGYRLVSYVSSKATVWDNVAIGENCMIFENAVLQPFADVGDNCIIRSSVHISHHVSVGDHCFVSAGSIIGGCATIGDQSFIGLGSTVRDNLKLGHKTCLAAGSVLMKDTIENGLYLGVPARKQEKPADEAV